VNLEKLRKQVGDSKNVYMTLDKAEDFEKRLLMVTEDKDRLEEEYFNMRTKYRSNQLQMDDALSKSEHFQELIEVLQKSKQSELSDRMIALSEKMQGLRLSEMRANRELNEVKEKNEYFARLLRTSTASVKKLEEQCAELESKIMKKEEEFRRADNERMRKFFNARYDDIPAAFANPGNGGSNEIGRNRPGANRRDNPDDSFLSNSNKGGNPPPSGRGGQPSSVARNAMSLLNDFSVPIGGGK
jgi:chromosome segregation ATPase